MQVKGIHMPLALGKELSGISQKEMYSRQSKKTNSMHLGLENKLQVKKGPTNPVNLESVCLIYFQYCESYLWQ